MNEFYMLLTCFYFVILINVLSIFMELVCILSLYNKISGLMMYLVGKIKKTSNIKY